MNQVHLKEVGARLLGSRDLNGRDAAGSGGNGRRQPCVPGAGTEWRPVPTEPATADLDQGTADTSGPGCPPFVGDSQVEQLIRLAGGQGQPGLRRFDPDRVALRYEVAGSP